MSSAKGFFAIFIAAGLLFAAGCNSTSNRASTGEYIDDATITTKVKTAILGEPSLKVAQINVETYKNVVQLSGFVATSAEYHTAGQVASAVKGVASVKNDIRLK